MPGKGYPADWQSRRKAILRRDNNLCLIQGPTCTLVAEEVDHIQPLAEGGSNHPQNLRSVCRACHSTRQPPRHSRKWV